MEVSVGNYMCLLYKFFDVWAPAHKIQLAIFYVIMLEPVFYCICDFCVYSINTADWWM